MSDVGFALEAKSDQLNAVDIMGVEPVIKVRKVDVKQGRDQKVWIYYEGDNNRPWKPSVGMLRIISGAWGRESDGWIGRHAQIFCENSVTWAGKEVGGIQVRALSDIPKEGLNFILAISSKKRVPFFVAFLEVEAKAYPVENFNKALPTMAKKMQSGEMTLQQIIAKCQETGTLTDDQLKKLEESAPVIIEDDETPIETESSPEGDQSE